MARRLRSPEAVETARRIGARIRDARMSRGLSQRQLGHALGVTHQAVNKYELANVDLSIASLLALAHALGVSPAFLIGETRPTRSKASQGPQRAGLQTAGPWADATEVQPRPRDGTPDKPG